MRNKIILIILTLFLIGQSLGLTYAGTGKVGGLFLREDIGARPLGMGSAFTAVADDSSGLNANPGGLDYIPYPELMMMYKKGFMDTYYGYLGCTVPFRQKGTLGIGTMVFDGGDIDLNYLDGRTETVKMEQDRVTTIGYGHSLSFLPFPQSVGEMFFLGANFKFIQSTLGEKYTANTYAGDLGFIFRTIDKKISLGLALQNYGPGLKYRSVQEKLPTNIRAGLGVVVKEWTESNLLAAADYIQTNGETAKINLGMEYWFLKSVALRAGYKLGYNPNIYTLGLGFFLFRTKLDYGFVSSVIDPTHRISLTVKFGSPDKTELAKKYDEKRMHSRAEYLRSQK
ncbi:MAG: PorV/PorQ family protein [Elusimicrobiota bacterium]